MADPEPAAAREVSVAMDVDDVAGAGAGPPHAAPGPSAADQPQAGGAGGPGPGAGASRREDGASEPGGNQAPSPPRGPEDAATRRFVGASAQQAQILREVARDHAKARNTDTRHHGIGFSPERCRRSPREHRRPTEYWRGSGEHAAEALAAASARPAKKTSGPVSFVPAASGQHAPPQSTAAQPTATRREDE